MRLSAFRRIGWGWKVAIILGAVFIVSVLIGIAQGEWSAGWNDGDDTGVAARIGHALGYTFASGFFTFVLPVAVLIVAPIAVIVGIVVFIRRRVRRKPNV